MTPSQAQSLLQQAQAYANAGRVPEAIDCCRQVLKSRPRELGANYIMAILQAQQGDVPQAAKFFRAAVKIKPDFLDARYNLAYALNVIGEHDEAAGHYEAVLRADSQHVNALVNYANTLSALGRHADALAAYDKLIRLTPNAAAAYANRGAVLKELKRLDEALADCDKAIALDPSPADAHSNRGLVLHALKRYDEALASHEQVLALRPDNAGDHFNRGATLHELRRFDEALDSYAKALALKPDHAEAWFNRGVTLHELKRLDEALESYGKALALRPDYDQPRFGRGVVHLLRGDFERGWPDYEYRKKSKNPLGDRPLRRPLWRGEASVVGQRVLVHTEQGLGDTIQFCRYLTLLEQKGVQVLFAPQPPLKGLMRSLGGTSEVVDPSDRSLTFDLHIPLMSLPLAFKTTAGTIPSGVPYLAGDRARAEAWAGRIGTQGFRIGICWQGGITAIDVGRSFHVREFLPLSQVPDVRLISLHKGEGERQLAELPGGMRVETLGDDFDAGPDAFLDSAAAMQSLDLVITSDTAIAHLAGALGRPAWVALPYVPDWRWQLDRADSPWYPTLRLFRQPRIGDWKGLFVQINAALTEYLGRARP